MNELNDMEQLRREYSERILQSDDRFKLIVAGPGTGKTYTFKGLSERNLGENLVLTFINNLADDIAQDLADLAKVQTFHSYCLKLLHKLPSDGIDSHFYFFPKLNQVVARDAEILESDIKALPRVFDEAFQSLVEDDGRIEFFLGRANFYNAVGFDDSVYRVLNCFREDSNRIPAVQQLILDEYQDFNALEVEFIDYLESKSPTLIVGDDDQAVYAFRHASPDYLRNKASHPIFVTFSLPYCSRCTEVVIKATDSVIENACARGLLANRLKKRYVCYIPDKKADNEKYPFIIHAQCSTHSKRIPYISKYIARVIEQIPSEEIEEALKKEYPAALIVGPSHYLAQIYEHLKVRFANVVYQTPTDKGLTLLDGYLCLLKDGRSNLGWRVILELEAPQSVGRLITATSKEDCDLVDVLDHEFWRQHQQRLDILKKLKQDETELTPSEIADLETYFDMQFQKLLEQMRKAAPQSSTEPEDNPCEEGEHTSGQPLIRLTTYTGCKGLSSGFTFVTGLEDTVFPKQNASPLDREVCQFIVALTRTHKQCHLVSTGYFAGQRRTPSVFLNWIPNNLIEQIKVNKSYFTN